jgi:hypothetical protein
MGDRYIVIERGGESEVWRRCSGSTGCRCGVVFHSKMAVASHAYALIIAKALNDAEPQRPEARNDEREEAGWDQHG